MKDKPIFLWYLSTAFGEFSSRWEPLDQPSTPLLSLGEGRYFRGAINSDVVLSQKVAFL
jgi:hypothetical protein